VYAQNTKKN